MAQLRNPELSSAPHRLLRQAYRYSQLDGGGGDGPGRGDPSQRPPLEARNG